MNNSKGYAPDGSLATSFRESGVPGAVVMRSTLAGLPGATPDGPGHAPGQLPARVVAVSATPGSEEEVLPVVGAPRGFSQGVVKSAAALNVCG